MAHLACFNTTPAVGCNLDGDVFQYGCGVYWPCCRRHSSAQTLLGICSLELGDKTHVSYHWRAPKWGSFRNIRSTAESFGYTNRDNFGTCYTNNPNYDYCSLV